MFILTCPNCGHQSRVKFARMGATAKCTDCKEPFSVDAATLAMQQGEGGGAVEEIPQYSAPLEELKFTRPGDPESDDPAVQQLAQVVVDPNDSSKAPPPGRRRSLLREFQRRTNLDPILVGLFTLIAVGFIALAGLMLRGDDPDLARVESGMDQPGPVVEAPVPTDSDPSDVPEPTEPTTTAEAPPPSTDPAPAAQVPGAPMLTLSGSVGNHPSWMAVSPPRDLFTTNIDNGALIWSTQVERRSDGQGLFTGIYLGESAAVYRAAFLHVQLINGQGQVYAELKQTVPVLCARQGLEVRVPVPAELLTEYAQVTAEFTPLEPLVDAVPLEMAASGPELVDETDGSPILQLAVANPFDDPVMNPTVVIAVLSADGWPLGEWRGKLVGQIEPHESLTFQAAPPLAGGPDPARVVLRGYAQKP